MKTKDKERLFREATLTKVSSYSPYSKFRVGAALICKDSNIIAGTNVECSSYPCGICAERNALFAAYSKGYRKDDIVAIAISGDSKNYIYPCGLCCQVICELMNPDSSLFLLNAKGEPKEIKVKKLLPYLFNEDSLNV